MRIAVLLACICLGGCSYRHIKAPGSLNYTVGQECHVTLQMTKCDKASPPHCLRVLANYDKYCEQLSLK